MEIFQFYRSIWRALPCHSFRVLTLAQPCFATFRSGYLSRHASWALGELIYINSVSYSNANEILKAILPDWIYSWMHFTLAPSCMQFYNYCSTLLPWSIRHHKVEHRVFKQPCVDYKYALLTFLVFKASCR